MNSDHVDGTLTKDQVQFIEEHRLDFAPDIAIEKGREVVFTTTTGGRLWMTYGCQRLWA